MSESEPTTPRRDFLKTMTVAAMAPAFSAQAASNSAAGVPTGPIASQPSARTPAALPTIASEWTRVVEYPNNHVNDFCLFLALDNRWHAIGILGTGTWDSERSLFHCSSPKLLGQYEIHEPLFANLEQGATENTMPQKHAPFGVVADGLHHLFVRRPPGTNMHFVTPDAMRWPAKFDVVFEERDARDACIQNFDGLWHWYYVQRHPVDGIERSCVMLRTSPDLRTWSAGRPAFVDLTRVVNHSQLESPFILKHDGVYYLFVRDRTKDSPATRNPVTIWSSPKPDHFDSTPPPLALWPDVHAPEMVRHEGKWYVARTAGRSQAPHGRKCAIEIAELKFE